MKYAHFLSLQRSIHCEDCCRILLDWSDNYKPVQIPSAQIRKKNGKISVPISLMF